MYKMPEFTEQDQQAVMQFMKDHSFVTLIGHDGVNSAATQIPVLFSEREGKLFLLGHIMRKTDHHLAFLKNNKVLVLFQGPHCYVSASWYSQRGIGSTWNYMTVHVRGIIRFFEDEQQTVQLIKDLTHHYEDGRQQPELVENMSSEYVSSMVKAIAGFEIEIQQIHPVFKLSQNRDDESYERIVKELKRTGRAQEAQIIEEMIQRRPHLFETNTTNA